MWKSVPMFTFLPWESLICTYAQLGQGPPSREGKVLAFNSISAIQCMTLNESTNLFELRPILISKWGALIRWPQIHLLDLRGCDSLLIKNLIILSSKLLHAFFDYKFFPWHSYIILELWIYLRRVRLALQI